MKKRIRKTGETVKIIVYSNIRGSDRDDTDFVYYIDSKGVEHYANRLNMCLDFEDVVKVPNAHINWEKVRIKAAIEVMKPLVGSMCPFIEDHKIQWTVSNSVKIADALIAELKKGGEK